LEFNGEHSIGTLIYTIYIYIGSLKVSDNVLCLFADVSRVFRLREMATLSLRFASETLQMAARDNIIGITPVFKKILY